MGIASCSISQPVTPTPSSLLMVKPTIPVHLRQVTIRSAKLPLPAGPLPALPAITMMTPTASCSRPGRPLPVPSIIPRLGQIIIAKETDPDGENQLFDFTASYTDTFQLADGQTHNSGPLAPGNYTVSENPTAGWSLTGATCDNGDTPDNIQLDAGETVTCTFNNAYAYGIYLPVIINQSSLETSQVKPVFLAVYEIKVEALIGTAGVDDIYILSLTASKTSNTRGSSTQASVPLDCRIHRFYSLIVLQKNWKIWGGETVISFKHLLAFCIENYSKMYDFIGKHPRILHEKNQDCSRDSSSGFFSLYQHNISSATSSLLESIQWSHLTSKAGDLPAPSGSTQQTASLVLDINKDGKLDFVIGSRENPGPSLVWYRRGENNWEKFIIDNSVLPIEAGGAFSDIDSDGDLDIVMGGDYSSSEVWWWENPFPVYTEGSPWIRRPIKDSGSTKHHDQIFGDFDGDGRDELVFWNQGSGSLNLAEIPSNPRNAKNWPYTQIYTWDSGEEHEGLVKIDMDGDGKTDIVGGGRWFKHNGGTSFTANVIDDSRRFTRVAAGQLVEGGRPEIVFVIGDGSGPLGWYEWVGNSWVRHILVDTVEHGHSLEIADINGDGYLDIFNAEMRLFSGNSDAKMWLFWGNGNGDFSMEEIATQFGNHESRIADLDGDGDLDILGKPYDWDTPRIDIWLNESPSHLDRWARHVVDDARPWKAIFITSADFDGDSLPDIVTGGWWYKNPGEADGTWVRNTIGSPLNNLAVVQDFDEDGDMDVLGTQGEGSNANPSLVWAQNDGSGAFTIFDNVSPGEGDFLQGTAIERFQPGGMYQVALSWHDANKGIQMLTVPSNPAEGVWTWQRISSISQDEALSAGDIDRDGDLDLLLGSKWLRNDGASWTILPLDSTLEPPDRNVLADINKDNRLDAVVGFEAISTPGKLAWYEQGDNPASAWSEHLIAMVIGPMSLDAADMDSDGDYDVVVGEHNLEDSANARLHVFENVDGFGNQWLDHTDLYWRRTS